MIENNHWAKDGKAMAAICWIAVGVIFLSINFNLLRPDLIAEFWKLWPLIPLAVGIVTLLGVRDRSWPVAKDN